MFAGQAKMQMRQNNQGQWEVRVGRDYWHAFNTEEDAELVASAGRLFCDPPPQISTMRETVRALEQTAACNHVEVIAFHTNLKKKIEEQEEAMR